MITVSAYVTFAMRLQVIWEAGIDCSSPFVSARARIPLPEAAILVGITAGNREKNELLKSTLSRSLGSGRETV